MHMFAGTILKGKSIDGYIEGGLVNPHKITIRHDQLMHEMLRRGLNHKSILEFDSAYLPSHPVDPCLSVKELKKRCEHCAARIYLYGIPLLKTNRVNGDGGMYD